MPRRRRKLSPIDTYHVMLRGINYQQIFEEELDYTKFLNILRECLLLDGQSCSFIIVC